MDILNGVASTGTYPEEIKIGLLSPLQKPGKKVGPPSNLRPIILLSMIRKILAIIMIKRITDRVLQVIPHTQAAYQSGRSTTEHVAALKLLAELAITTQDNTIYMLLLDMSMAFDTVNRHKPFEMLKTFLEEDEIHILKILTEDVTLRVKIENEIGIDIITDIGVPQGDCLSALLFIIYLAFALNSNRMEIDHDHNYSLDRYYGPQNTVSKEQRERIRELNIACQYADDMVNVTSIKGQKEIIKREMTEQLESYNLHVNETKTEEYEITPKGGEEWKNCKFLGTLLDTSKDIQRRKGLAIAAYKQQEKIFNSNKISLKIKLRCFNTYISSIFLYNSCLWTITKSLEQQIDAFHRRLLRRILKIKWPRKITNDEVYEKTKEIKCSKIIQYY